MASTNAVTETLSSFFSGAVGTGAIVIIVFLIVLTIVGFFYYFGYYRRKFNVYVKITSERANDPKESFDKARILFDKKKNTKYLRLLNTRVDLEAPPFKLMRRTNWGDYIEIHRTSDDNFCYLTIPRIDNKTFLSRDGRILPINRMEQRFIENDIYWTIRRKQENKKLLDPESLLMKLIEIAPIIFAFGILFMMLWLVLDKFPQIISSLDRITERLFVADSGTTTKIFATLLQGVTG